MTDHSTAQAPLFAVPNSTEWMEQHGRQRVAGLPMQRPSLVERVLRRKIP